MLTDCRIRKEVSGVSGMRVLDMKCYDIRKEIYLRREGSLHAYVRKFIFIREKKNFHTYENLPAHVRKFTSIRKEKYKNNN
jgi:hypothetical protein